MYKLLILMMLSFSVFAGAGEEYYEPGDVMIICNINSPVSVEICDYIADKYELDADQRCSVSTADSEDISRPLLFSQLVEPIKTCLNATTRVINYLVTTKGIPHRMLHPGISFRNSVDSSLTLVGGPYEVSIGEQGGILNPYYNSNQPLTFAAFGVRGVTRLTAYTVAEVISMIDRADEPEEQGNFVFDILPGGFTLGNMWMQAGEVIASTAGFTTTLDETKLFLTSSTNVLGYFSYGSNDWNSTTGGNPGNSWLNGSITAPIVSTSAITFTKGVPHNQSLIADLIEEGANSAAGYVFEPYLLGTSNIDILVKKYTSCSTMVDAYMASMQYLDWQTVIVGCPKMAICRP